MIRCVSWLAFPPRNLFRRAATPLDASGACVLERTSLRLAPTLVPFACFFNR